ncbi:MAG: glycoside hydrolase family 19 protein [Gammaproteobacteria bacterium]|nr:glycoside hydrolase family 19 protein [Gammaproteobacteria bacterium]
MAGISEAVLLSVARCRPELASVWFEPLAEAMDAYSINTPARVAAFLAQVLHESANLTCLTENLKYSPERLVQVWPRHFYLPPQESPRRHDATQYAYRPEPLANLIYASRMGNGPALSGDGWRFRGRGLMQLTGRTNYERAASGLGVDLVNDPDLLLTPKYAALSAAWYWSSIDGNALADEETEAAFERLTIAINGELIGFKERLEIWRRAKKLFGSSP